jgi:cell division septum initiation protein DivIVA
MLQPPLYSDSPDNDSPINSDHRQLNEAPEPNIEVDSNHIEAALDRLEETILNSPRVPLTGKTMINEEALLEQIDLIRLSIPPAIKTAQEVLQYKNQIIQETQQQAQQMLAEANQHAYHIANELGIIERAEQEAREIHQIAVSQAEQMRQQTIIEVERIRDLNIQEIERMRQETIAECQSIQSGADEYADRILSQMEEQFTDILQSIKMGRQRLNSSSIQSPKQ